jgi:hypothetical protein
MKLRTCMCLSLPTSSGMSDWYTRLFIDQPVGTGFSYGTKNVGTSDQAAADIWKFLQIWFADPRFSKYAHRNFGIWTESYGGHYGPTFAACVPRRGRILIVDCRRLQLFLATERCDQVRYCSGRNYQPDGARNWQWSHSTALRYASLADALLMVPNRTHFPNTLAT